MPLQLSERLAQGTVGFHAPLLKLSMDPGLSSPQYRR